MSQRHQDDDDGTVIRPSTVGSTWSASTTSASQSGPAGPRDDAEDGLSLRIGARLGEFEITQRLGDGGFSIVYLARDHSLERTVALKEYMPSSLATRVGTTQVQPRSHRYRDTFEAGLKSFVNEAKLLAQFDHPSLVKVYRFWEANGTAYMVMPFYQGVTVKEAVRAMPRPPDEAWLLALLAPLTEALVVIHADRCYHRDIAPDNVILLAGSAKPLLLDFGAARRVIGDMTQALTVILKAGYAPVEQYAEVPGMKQGPWTDVYALAAVVYWAITGSTPPASVGRMVSDSFVPLAQCAAGRYSPRFLQAVDRALAVLPERRTQTIEAFRQDLGLHGQERKPPPLPLPLQDPEATVLRPVVRTPGPVVNAPIATASAPPASTARHDKKGLPPRQARPDDATAGRLPARSGEPSPNRLRLTLAVVAMLGVMAAAGVWRAMQEPSEPGKPEAEGSARHAEPSAPPTTLPATPTDTLPTVAGPVASDPERDTTEPPPPPVITSPPPPPVGPTDNDVVVEGPKKRVPSPKTANKAECDRLIQRLSLESTPELMERLKTLKCQ